MAQRWVHNFGIIRAQTDETLEGWIGRRKNDSVELKNKPPTSHVARMTSGFLRLGVAHNRGPLAGKGVLGPEGLEKHRWEGRGRVRQNSPENDEVVTE